VTSFAGFPEAGTGRRSGWAAELVRNRRLRTIWHGHLHQQRECLGGTLGGKIAIRAAQAKACPLPAWIALFW